MAHHMPPEKVMSLTQPGYDIGVLRDELERDEGVRADMYKDTRGNWTVGIGHNLSIAQNTFTVDALFQNDINGCEASLDLHWPWWRQLDTVRQRVMLNMIFNMGSGTLGTFPKFLAAMQAGNWMTAGAEMMNSAWAHEVGQRAVRLHQMVLTGIAPAVQ